ncbi:MAG: hypothetical protein AAFN93_20725 [Bacteroidota bacterium]
MRIIDSNILFQRMGKCFLAAIMAVTLFMVSGYSEFSNVRPAYETPRTEDVNIRETSSHNYFNLFSNVENLERVLTNWQGLNNELLQLAHSRNHQIEFTNQRLTYNDCQPSIKRLLINALNTSKEPSNNLFIG